MGKIKQALILVVFTASSVLSSCTGVPADTRHGKSQAFWKLSSPEKQGMDSETLVKLLEYIHEQDKGIHSILVIRNGYIVLEAYYSSYTPDKLHTLIPAPKASFRPWLVLLSIKGTS
jgi:hypothetical protein